MCRVIAMSDVVGAASEAFSSGTDGLSYDNWDTMPLNDLEEALVGAGVGSEKPTKQPTVIPVPSSVVADVKRRSGLLRGKRG